MARAILSLLDYYENAKRAHVIYNQIIQNYSGESSMDWWSGTLGNIVASLIGTIAGYFAGLKLFKNQLREDEKRKK